MRLLLALLALGVVACSSGAPYVRAKHEGISVEAGRRGAKTGDPYEDVERQTAACDDQLRVLLARLRYYCTPAFGSPALVCLEITALDAWSKGVRCFRE